MDLADIAVDIYVFEQGYERFMLLNWNPYDAFIPTKLGKDYGLMELSLLYNIHEDRTRLSCATGDLSGKDS